jgi:diaminopimelate decarboxylase
LEYINYGGGFGVPYENYEQPLDLHKLANQIKTPDGIRLNLELGRYLVAEAGLFITRVVDIKESFGIKYIILDGGMNAFFRPKFTGQHHRVHVLGKREMATQTVALTGNTCTPLDVFYEEIELPVLEIDDLLIFENAGAYGYSMSLLDFISFDKPVQIMEDF